jgi:acetyl esterase
MSPLLEMVLHPELSSMARLGQFDPPIEAREPAAARALLDGLALKAQGPRPASIETRDERVDLPGRSLRVRIYRPRDNSKDLPAMVHFHGGGWMIGNVDVDDRYVAFLAASSGVAFVSVDYRLAPEHPYPAAINDAYDTLCWIYVNAKRLGLDAEKLGVSGDGPGGQLSAACTFLARDKNFPRLSFQLLVYPVTDCDFSRRSYHTWKGLPLTTPYMQWFWRNLCGDQLPMDDPLAVPLRNPDLRALPPAYVVTAEFDILRDEGELYARRLMDAGVPTTLKRVIGAPNPFFRGMASSRYVRDEMREMGHQVRRALVLS